MEFVAMYFLGIATAFHMDMVLIYLFYPEIDDDEFGDSLNVVTMLIYTIVLSWFAVIMFSILLIIILVSRHLSGVKHRRKLRTECHAALETFF